MSGNAAMPPGPAIRRFGRPASMLSDNGARLAGRNGRKKGPTGTWQPTASEEGLLESGTAPINSGPCHPQTNGRPGRFRRSIGGEIWNYVSPDAYIDHCNERRPHVSLDIGNYETPLAAFGSKKAAEAIRKRDPQWMEKDDHE